MSGGWVRVSETRDGIYVSMYLSIYLCTLIHINHHHSNNNNNNNRERERSK